MRKIQNELDIVDVDYMGSRLLNEMKNEKNSNKLVLLVNIFLMINTRFHDDKS